MVIASACPECYRRDAGWCRKCEMPVAALFATINTEGRVSHTYEQLRKNAVLRALEFTNGNRVEAARMLGLARRTLYYRMGEYAGCGRQVEQIRAARHRVAKRRREMMEGVGIYEQPTSV